ncbi:MAG: DUF169 domain-containing protein [Candidatus Rokubacteria bacterium]|nr:DUF169 domain-containing protein [Candidatus Rokubacteria bacterium]
MPQTSLTDLLTLASPPVAISFVDAPPSGVPHVSSMEAAGCGYWRRAAEGATFFTVADDHKRCPVGAHTHNVPLSAPEKQELMGLVQTMVDLSYLKMDEVPQIPTRTTPMKVAVYAPLADAPVPPDVVLVRGNARQLMLLAEAAQAAGVAGSGATMGRPTCAVLPEAINSARTAASFGCIGNRVYTGADDTEAYFAIPGAQLGAVEERLSVIVRANQELEKFHRARAAATPAA